MPRIRVTLFHDMIHHEFECYVDDMIAKSQTEKGHLVDLAKLFDRIETTQTEVESEQVYVWGEIREAFRLHCQ